MVVVRYAGGDEIIKGAQEGTIGSIVEGLVLMHGGWQNIDGFIFSKVEDRYAITVFKDGKQYYYVYEVVKEVPVSKGV